MNAVGDWLIVDDKGNAMTTEYRTDRRGRRCKWYVLADGRAYRSEKQAKAAKPLKGKRKSAAEVMTQEQAFHFALAEETLSMGRTASMEYAKALHRYMVLGRDHDDIRPTLQTPIHRVMARLQAQD